jgi:hypothetical protein
MGGLQIGLCRTDVVTRELDRVHEVYEFWMIVVVVCEGEGMGLLFQHSLRVIECRA